MQHTEHPEKDHAKNPLSSYLAHVFKKFPIKHYYSTVNILARPTELMSILYTVKMKQMESNTIKYALTCFFNQSSLLVNYEDRLMNRSQSAINCISRVCHLKPSNYSITVKIWGLIVLQYITTKTISICLMNAAVIIAERWKKSSISRRWYYVKWRIVIKVTMIEIFLLGELFIKLHSQRWIRHKFAGKTVFQDNRIKNSCWPIFLYQTYLPLQKNPIVFVC